jgi:hypothetical protein
MTHITPEDGDGWRTGPSGARSPQDGVPAAVAGGGNQRTLLLAAAGGVAALVIVALVMVVGGSGGGGGDTGGGGDLGGALGSAATATIPSNAGTVREDSTTTTAAGEPDGAPAGGDLPPVTIPAESSPPTTIPGSEPSSVPTDLDGGEAPLFGHLVVDLEPGGYQDFPVHLRTDQEIQLLSLADDGINTDIEVFAPDGSSEGSWQGGEPGVVNGLEWYLPDEPIPATGTYVIRVIHRGGSDGPFALGFFGDA